MSLQIKVDVRHPVLAMGLAMLLGLVVGVGIPACAQQSETLSPPQRGGTSDSDPPAPQDEIGPESMFPHFKDTRFWLSGQANFIFQTHPEFHAPYSGPHSLSPRYEKATSRLLTLYTGVRLNNSTEILVDIEEAGGAALSTGFGLAGAPNLDIVRNPSLSKAPYLGRGMFHKVFAFSSDKIENHRNAFSLFEELPRRRLEFRIGKVMLKRLTIRNRQQIMRPWIRWILRDRSLDQLNPFIQTLLVKAKSREIKKADRVFGIQSEKPVESGR